MTGFFPLSNLLLVKLTAHSSFARFFQSNATCGIFCAILLSCSIAAGAADQLKYDVDYRVTLLPDTRSVQVEIQLGKNAKYIRWIRFKIDPNYHSGFNGDGSVKTTDRQVLWKPSPSGGSLFFNVKIDHRRKSGNYDALFEDDWAMFRGYDIVPQARVDMQDGTQANAKLTFYLPKRWSIVTPYGPGHNNSFKINDPNRSFDRPKGWIVTGKIGVKHERINGINVAVAAPKGQSVRRMDILAHLNWNLPTLLAIFPNFPKRILVVSAGNPMWRGALSAPNSLYLHADRPLISENGTSTLIHELVHIAMATRAKIGADWLVEGFAEYYSLEIMRRSGTISKARYKKAHRNLEEWGEEANKLNVKRSHGPITAKAVGVLLALDKEIRAKTDDKANLDDLAKALVAMKKDLSLERVRKISEQIVGTPMETLSDDSLL
ncbi:MAG: hypothetical protein V3U75_06080 [Methylococcaceae bacterium]